MVDKVLQSMSTFEEIMGEVLTCVLGTHFDYVVEEYKGVPTLQIFFDAYDADMGGVTEQACRKWTLQYTMSNTEVVRTAYKAAEAAVIHELQEGFRYRGARVMDPHLDVEAMVDYINREGLQDTRVAISKHTTKDIK